MDCGDDPAIQELDDLPAGVLVGAGPQGREQVGRGGVLALARGPAFPDPRGQELAAPPGAVGRVVAVGRVAVVVLEQGVGQRAEDRLGVLPADAVQRPPAIGHVDRLVADVAEVAGAVAEISS